MKKIITLVLAIIASAAISQNNLNPQMVNTAGGSGVVAGTYYDYTVGEPITLFGGIPSGCDSIFSGFQHCAIDTLRTNKATVGVSGATTFCLTQSVTLTAPAGTGNTYTWSNGATTQTVSVGTSGNYTVSTTNSCGDVIGSNTVVVTTINPQTPNICMVSTDSVTNYKYNIVYWEKAGYQHVDSFLIFRYYSVTGHYLKIGAVSKDSLSMYIDVDSTIGGPHGGNPSYNSWKYTLAIKDTCGNISALSPYHQTMFVQENLSNFSWTAYVDSGQASLPTGYAFLRDDNNTGVWNVLSYPGSTSTTDPNYASYPNGNWRVDALGFGDCTPTYRLAGGNNNPFATRVKSHSNTQRVAGGQTTGMNKVGSIGQVNVYPNPSNGTFNIQLSNYDNASIEVYNALGQKVLSQTLQTNLTQLNLADFSNGMYQLRVIKNNATVYQTKISKVD
jgi:type IX secretion system substrate protein